MCYYSRSDFPRPLFWGAGVVVCTTLAGEERAEDDGAWYYIFSGADLGPRDFGFNAAALDDDVLTVEL